jgi:hypothetical protein
MSLFFIYKIGEEGGRTRGLVWGSWYEWEGGEGGESAWEGEYSANTVYTCM